MGKCTITKNGKKLNAREELEYLMELKQEQREMLLEVQELTKEVLQNDEIILQIENRRRKEAK